MEAFSQKRIALFLLAASLALGILLFSIHQQLLWYWTLGLGFGYILEHFHMSFSAAITEPITCRSTAQFRAILIGILVSSFMISVFKYLTLGAYDLVGVFPVGIVLVIGAFLFGCGMVFASGGASGVLIQLGEGHIIHIITLICIVIGFSTANTVHRTFWTFFINRESFIFFPHNLGWKLGLAVNCAILLLFYVLAFKCECQPITINVSYIKGAICLGILSFLHIFVLTSPFSISEAFPWIADCFCRSISKNTYIVSNNLVARIAALGTNMRNLGFITGALISSLFSTNFHLRRDISKIQILSSIIGGFMMGYGACIAGGCNITSFFVAASALSLSGWIFLIALFVGAFVGTKLLQRFIQFKQQARQNPAQ